ncbi:hypothetical protein FACHB389_32655 [Nostoc calcicola FACHB-389]|nr:hypothetical protein FACHB389_32655 [Nostoc calcicola FACHB-389]
MQKSGKGEGERGKGLLFSLYPLTFSLFPPLAKRTFARGLFVICHSSFVKTEALGMGKRLQWQGATGRIMKNSCFAAAPSLPEFLTHRWGVGEVWGVWGDGGKCGEMGRWGDGGV